jgi:hypothetical protein
MRSYTRIVRIIYVAYVRSGYTDPLLWLIHGLLGLCLLAAQAGNLGSLMENPELNNPNQQFFDKQAIRTLHAYVLIALSYFCVGNEKFSP